MKLRILLKKFEQAGFIEDRRNKHIVMKRENGDTEEIPNHREVDERLARALIKKWGLK